MKNGGGWANMDKNQLGVLNGDEEGVAVTADQALNEF
jgi:hypothetical protein